MYWLMKIVHVLAVVVLLGNLLMAPFWRKRLAAVGGAQARATANRSVRMADLIFTLPGWVVVLATGIMLIVTRSSVARRSLSRRTPTVSASVIDLSMTPPSHRTLS